MYFNKKCIQFCFPGSLQIKNSDEKDHGKYECVAENSIGTDYSTSAILYVKGKDSFTNRLPQVPLFPA